MCKAIGTKLCMSKGFLIVQKARFNSCFSIYWQNEIEDMVQIKNDEIKGVVFSIERFAVHDGPGIRTLVFLKGCPLKCLWCDNPESQKMESQIFLISDRCIGCRQCLSTCPQGATTLSESGEIIINRKLCTNCGKCVETCYAGARVLTGKQMSVTEALEEIKKDLVFYRNSDGGVTLSGGEPLMQADFSEQILKECHELSIHTAIETSGYADWQSIEHVLYHVDLILLDIKQMDSSKHRRYTGVPNEPILENAKKMSDLRIPMIVRVPIVPRYNDSEENIRTTTEFVLQLKSVESIELLTYHSYGAPKYHRLGMRYSLTELKPPSKECIERLKNIVISYGLQCHCH